MGNLSYLGLRNKTQPFQLPGLFRAGGDEVNSGCLDAGVSQHIRQFDNILINTIERLSEQMPQIVGEYFRFLHFRLFAQRLEFRPDLAAGQTLSVSGEKDFAGDDFMFFGIFFQLPA